MLKTIIFFENETPSAAYRPNGGFCFAQPDYPPAACRRHPPSQRRARLWGVTPSPYVLPLAFPCVLLPLASPCVLLPLASPCEGRWCEAPKGWLLQFDLYETRVTAQAPKKLSPSVVTDRRLCASRELPAARYAKHFSRFFARSIYTIHPRAG